ncbi:MAG: hypothetical protein HQK67_01805 [Desulfamplus sp.]|nr:hypothetical protein [Desulfamplus sp.]
MLKYIIELIPSTESSVTLSSSEWAIIVMLNKYPDFNKLIIELKKSYNMSAEDIKASLVNLQKRKILKLFQTKVTDETPSAISENSAAVSEKSSAVSEKSSAISESSTAVSERSSGEQETSFIFWEQLENELSRAIGPIASIVIDDAISEFNIPKDKFPGKFLYSLIEKVAAEIQSHAEKTQFQKAMLEVIKQS